MSGRALGSDAIQRCRRFPALRRRSHPEQSCCANRLRPLARPSKTFADPRAQPLYVRLSGNGATIVGVVATFARRLKDGEICNKAWETFEFPVCGQRGVVAGAPNRHEGCDLRGTGIELDMVNMHIPEHRARLPLGPMFSKLRLIVRVVRIATMRRGLRPCRARSRLPRR